MEREDYSFKYQAYFRLAVIICIMLPVLLTTSCTKKDKDTWVILEDGLVGTWILKEAVFRNEIDLDGPGVMLPTTDAKTFLYNLLNVYSNCSSDEDISFNFSDDTPQEYEDVWLLPEARAAYAVCPEGFGVTAWIFDYQFLNNKIEESPPRITVVKKEIYDPANLMDRDYLFLNLDVTGDDTSDGKYSISGHSTNDSFNSIYPDYNPDMVFDFVLERVDTH